MKEKFVLVTGGAGYIGLNVVNALLENGKRVVVFDDLSNSYKRHIENLQKQNKNNLIFCKGDLKNREDIDKVFQKFEIDKVIHLAGKKYIGESFEKTKLYEKNNIFATKILLDTMSKYNVKKIVFSSSITVYGNASGEVDENSNISPISPYATQKAEGEEMIKTWAENSGANFVILRLSNPIGAGFEARYGENSKSKNKGVVPYLVECARNDQKIVLNGNDHDTRDGTTIRDYVFVEDVAKAFAKAVDYEENITMTVGSGESGFTVLEILKAVEKATNKKLDYSFREKREGDVSKLTTNAKSLKEIFGIVPNRNIDFLVKSHFNFVECEKKKEE